MCFWFVPPSLRGKQESLDYSERLAKVGFLPGALVNLVEQMDAAGVFLPPAGCGWHGRSLVWFPAPELGTELENTNLSSFLRDVDGESGMFLGSKQKIERALQISRQCT